MNTTARSIVALMVSRLEYALTNVWTIGLVVLVVLSSTSVVTTAAKRFAEHQEQHALEAQQRLGPSVAAKGPTGKEVDRSLRVLRPPSLAAILIPGEERSLPAAWDAGPATVEALPPYPPATVSDSARGASDLTSFVGQFGGILALAFGLTSVLRDRRRGWQDVERGSVAPPAALILAHLFSAALALFVLVTIWFLAIDFAVSQVEVQVWPEAGETLWQLAPLVWLFSVTLYSYGAAAAFVFGDPIKAVAATAVLWLVFVLLVPQLTAAWAASVPLQSRAKAEEERREEYADLVKAIDAEMANRIGPLLDHIVSPQERSARFKVLFRELDPVWHNGMAKARARADDLEAAWNQQAELVSSRRRQAAQLTPATLLPQVLAEMSGTGHHMRTRWERAVHDYKKRLDGALFDNRPFVQLVVPTAGDMELNYVERHPVRLTSELPRFEEPQISRSDRWQAARGDVFALVLHAVLALALAAVAQRRSWRRYDFVSSSADIGKP